MEKELFNEDFGMKFNGRYGRAAAYLDTIMFTLLTCKTDRIRLKIDYNERPPGEPFKGRFAFNDLFTLSTVTGKTIERTSSHVFTLEPVFHYTIYPECGVKSKRGRRQK